MTIGDGIASCGFFALIGWWLWLVHRRSVFEHEAKAGLGTAEQKEGGL